MSCHWHTPLDDLASPYQVTVSTWCLDNFGGFSAPTPCCCKPQQELLCYSSLQRWWWWFHHQHCGESVVPFVHPLPCLVDHPDFLPLVSMMVKQSDVFRKFFDGHGAYPVRPQVHTQTRDFTLTLDCTDCVVKYKCGLQRPMVIKISWHH